MFRYYLLAAVFLICLLAGKGSLAQSGGQTYPVYFSSGVHKLDPAAMRSLDSLLYQDLIHPGQQLTISGHADEPGGVALNRRLSRLRAQAVADYLVQEGFVARKDIVVASATTISAGRGEDPLLRRADIQVGSAPVAMQMPAPPTPLPAPAAPKLARRLDSVAVNATMVLDNLQFYGGVATLVPASIPAMEALLQALKEKPSLKICLEGHTCCGRHTLVMDDHDRTLSQDRAKTIYTYLVEHGIAPERLSWKGFGFSMPKYYDEVNDEQREANRRVEVRVLSK